MEMEVNKDAQLACDLVMKTGSNVFLTGRAGTGKTTFLKHLREISFKRMVVLAPTGVAAINAGGMTIHSFFQLSFEPFVPGYRAKADKRFSFRKEKLDIIRSLDLVVIDEISMVRADLLDAIDDVLRQKRGDQRPFGGVQLLLIGDMQQLPPVLTGEDERLLGSYYPSPYFFHSKALQRAGYVCVELRKVYRQSDQQFVDLLNEVRDGKITKKTLELLNSRFIPGFVPPRNEEYIQLTTHNSLADKVNEDRLKALKTSAYTFSAMVKGSFPEKSYPTEGELILKEGAQVMFVKNDPSYEKLYYNGKIGIVEDLDRNTVKVRCADGKLIEVAPVEWENVRYEISDKTKEIEQVVDGVFTQYPLKLAWSITVHKSQGLTFDHVMLDVASAFAHGQVYVALSRCRTLEGIVLTQAIDSSAVITEREVTEFNEHMDETKPTTEQLSQMERDYILSLMNEQFSFEAFVAPLATLVGLYRNSLGRIYGGIDRLVQEQDRYMKEVLQVGENFKAQINRLFAEGRMDYLNERTGKGAVYFIDKLKEIVDPMLRHAMVEAGSKADKETLETVSKAMMAFRREKNDTLKLLIDAPFSVTSYLTARNLAVLSGETGRTRQEKEPPRRSYEGIRYPDFYDELIRWRQRKAKDQGVQPQKLLPQRLMVQIVNLRPKTLQIFESIAGVGDKIKSFSNDIISMALNDALFVKQNKVEEKESTQDISFRLLGEGYTIEGIAQERGLKEETILGHLARAVEQGKLKADSIVPRSKLKIVEKVVAKNPEAVGKELKELLPPSIGYGEMAVALAFLKFSKRSK